MRKLLITLPLEASFCTAPGRRCLVLDSPFGAAAPFLVQRAETLPAIGINARHPAVSDLFNFWLSIKKKEIDAPSR
jgi:hypothetical protein